MNFTDEQVMRYSRHIILKEVGGEGQQKLLDAKVLVVGAGGLGCPVGYFLAAAGVGTLAMVDDDTVEISNLQRQIAHNTGRIGMSKADSCKLTFEALNPDCNVVPVKARLSAKNALDLFRQYDVIVDGSDNFPTRYMVNDACVLAGRPLVSGAILRFEGQATTIIPGKGHCYRCLFEEPPPAGLVPSCAEAGVIGALPGVIGGIQATEVIKLILGVGEPLKNRLLIYDALAMSFRTVKVPRNPACPVCGESPTITEVKDYSGDEYCSL
jgi:adenylyltransferase/sulfurtransferase